jgi:excisionase family DNA binding protein
MPEKQWFNVSEAAKYLGISRDTLYKLMDQGLLPYYTLKGVQKRRLKKEDLDALTERGGGEPTEQKKK